LAAKNRQIVKNICDDQFLTAKASNKYLWHISLFGSSKPKRVFYFYFNSFFSSEKNKSEGVRCILSFFSFWRECVPLIFLKVIQFIGGP
jgi:hypothetical protein